MATKGAPSETVLSTAAGGPAAAAPPDEAGGLDTNEGPPPLTRAKKCRFQGNEWWPAPAVLPDDACRTHCTCDEPGEGPPPLTRAEEFALKGDGWAAQMIKLITGEEATAAQIALGPAIVALQAAAALPASPASGSAPTGALPAPASGAAAVGGTPAVPDPWTMSEEEQAAFDARPRPRGPSAAARADLSGSVQFHCRVCSTYFNEAGYTAHLHSAEHVHSVNCQGTLYCELCRKLFNNRWDLKQHVSTSLHQLAADEAKRTNN